MSQNVAQATAHLNNVVTPLRRSPLTPGLAAAAKRFGIRPDAVKRHEEFEKMRERDMNILQAQRMAAKTKYNVLKGQVDELVEKIQTVAQAPNKAQVGDIQNIRTLLSQAYQAMERQQKELKGIRARTQRMERAAIKADTVHNEVDLIRSEITGFERALHMIRGDMAALLDVVEGEGGLKDLALEINQLKDEVKDTQTRTDKLETTTRALQETTEDLSMDQAKLFQKADDLAQDARALESGMDVHTHRIEKLEAEIRSLRKQLECNIGDTAGIAGALFALKEEVTTLHKRMGRYIISQIRFTRQNG